jgi:hypothetical protein
MTRGLTTGIIFIPLDVRWPRSKKVRAMIVAHGLEGLAAWGLYTAMACYCREGLTDGFVPAAEVGALAYPLAPDQADGLLKLLLDYRLVADSPGHSPGHSDGHSPGHSQGHTEGHSQGHGPGYVVRGYLKRNGSRADAEQLAAKLAEAGRSGGLTRWSRSGDSPGHSPGHSRGFKPTATQTETESENPAHAGAHAHAPAREGWTPHSALDQDHQAQQRRPRGTRTPPPAQTALAKAHRPGGPTADVGAWAAKARAGITKPEDTQPDPDPEPAQQDPDPATAEEPAEDEIPF